MTVLVLAAISWGVLAFGAVYPWAYWPLFAAAATAGVLGLFSGEWITPLPHKALTLAFLAIAVGTALQLLPLPRQTLSMVSPSTDALLSQYDLPYATGLVDVHALSIRADATRLALAALVALGAFTLGIARVLARMGPSRVACSVVAVGALVAVIGIVQRAMPSETIYGFWRPVHNPYLIFGPFVNRNHFAGWMIMALSLAIGALCGAIAGAMRGVRPDWRSRVLWISSREANQLVLVAVAAVVMALSLVLTRSRSGIVCFGATLALASWFVIRRRERGPARQVVAAAYLLMLALVTVSWAGIDPVVNRFTTDPALAGRASAWRAAARIARDFPVTGTGLNTYGAAVLFYASPDMTSHWDAAHNDYVQLAAEGGLLVGAPVAVALLVFLREVRSRFREAADDAATYWIRAGAVMGIIAMALQELVDFSLQIPGNAVLFALLCAIAIHAPGTRGHRDARVARAA